MKKDEKTKYLYILLTDTGTLFSKVIKLYTSATYPHVSLSLDKHLHELYSFGRKHPRNPLNGGFVKEDVYQGIYRYFPNTRCILFKLPVTNKQYEQTKRIVRAFQKRQEVYRYNLLGLFGVMIDYPIGLKNAYFCSHFVAHVLKKSQIELWNKPSSLVTPNDFFHHASLEVVYEGKLYDYPFLQTNECLLYQQSSPLPPLYERIKR